jgi:hypothetical protein
MDCAVRVFAGRRFESSVVATSEEMRVMGHDFDWNGTGCIGGKR